MAAKTKINDHGDVIFSEEDTIELLYTDPNFDITKLYLNDIDKYTQRFRWLGLRDTARDKRYSLLEPPIMFI